MNLTLTDRPLSAPISLSDTAVCPGGVAALGNTQVEFPRTASDPALRRLRYSRRRRSSEVLIGSTIEKTGSVEMKDFPRVARCGWALGSNTDVRVNRSADGHRATFGSVETCASVWACPTCAAVIRAQRAADIQTAVENWRKKGNSVVFLTLTLRHYKDDTLKTSLDALIKGFQRTLARRAWLKLKADMGIAGFVRSVEVTYGENGWHPHIHALLFLEGSVSADSLSRIEGFYADHWANIVEKLGARRPDDRHGYDVQLVDGDGKVLSAYLGKLQDEGKKKANVSAEIARFDIKTAYGSSVVPFELLDDGNPYQEQSARLWEEFVTSTRGRRAITWAKGTRELCGLDAEELDDEELLEQDEVHSSVVFLIPNAVYRKIMRIPGRLPLILDYVEAGLISQAADLCEGYFLDEVENATP